MASTDSAHEPGVRRRPAGVGAIAPFGLALIAAGAAPAAPLAAQTGVVLAGHLGSSAAAPGGVMVDLAGEAQRGVWGVRVGAGMDAASTALAPMVSQSGGSSGAWTADVDLGLNVGRIPYIGALFGRSDPTAFLGIGMAGVSRADEAEPGTSGSVVPTWTWGGRAGVPIASWLGFEVEARRREMFGEPSPEAYPAGESWEYRAGLALRFGGRTAAARPVSTSRRGGSAGDREVGRSIPTRDARRPASAEEISERTIRTGERYLGTPYRWGGESPSQGFDCSGFVRYVFREQGIELPRVSRDQAHAGRPLPTSLDGLARGDLLFFAGNGRTVSHVAIYAGDGRILHSSSSGSGVRYDDLSGNRGRWYVDHLVAVRRVIDGGEPLGGMLAGENRSPMPRRELPLDEAFDAIEAERGDEAPPPEF